LDDESITHTMWLTFVSSSSTTVGCLLLRQLNAKHLIYWHQSCIYAQCREWQCSFVWLVVIHLLIAVVQTLVIDTYAVLVQLYET